MKQYIKIHRDDNVAVALDFIEKNKEISIDGEDIKILENISKGHKFALKDINKGEKIIKYGNSIGHAKNCIKKGEWVHVHNIKTNLDNICTYNYKNDFKKTISSIEEYFNGYIRADGKVGIRNEIWIIPTVGCVNNIATAIENKSQYLLNENIDCITAFTHPYGCSQMGEDQENTRKILSNLINHPNAVGVIVLGLGCENSNIEVLKKYIGDYDEKRVKFLCCQDCEDEIKTALDFVKELVDYANTFKREPVNCKELVVGLKCGGSDGLSGITANPTAGVFSDILISKGGTTILTEVPEMFGAEQLLMDRCMNKDIFDKTVDLINNYKDYFIMHNQTIYENPSPGNKQGGISTLEDKSLGCTQKSGSCPIVDVLSYGQKVKKKGLNLLSAPGNDLVASTALACSGAHIVLFTTGRGTPFASPVPTIKISSNSQLAQLKSNWIDFDCGGVVNDISINTLGQKLFDYVIKVASGELVKSEVAGYHDMAIFKQGVTL